MEIKIKLPKDRKKRMEKINKLRKDPNMKLIFPEKAKIRRKQEEDMLLYGLGFDEIYEEDFDDVYKAKKKALKHLKDMLKKDNDSLKNKEGHIKFAIGGVNLEYQYDNENLLYAIKETIKSLERDIKKHELIEKMI